jgi:hypothetical protein
LIKGHTKIELTNVKTGQKKVVEDTNMVTNGMSNFLMSNPYNHQALSVDSMPFSTQVPRSYQLCGGLLLFDKPIEEDPDMIFPPAGHKMIGNAVAGISSGNAIPEFGYFDANNSTLEYNGDTTTQKFVFDFGTSQANGQISSVCLASMLAGYMGFGNNSGKKVAETIGNLKFGDSNFNPFDSSYFGHSITSHFNPFYEGKWAFPFMFDYKKNCVYTSHVNAFYYSADYPDEHFSSGSLKLNKLYCPLSSWNPLQYFWSGQSKTKIFTQSCPVSIPSEILGLDVSILKTRNQVFHSYDGTYLIVGGRKANYLEPNDIIYVVHVNADLETKLYTVKNTTGERLWNVFAANGKSSSDVMAVKDGYLFCQRYTSSSDNALMVYKISLTDSTDVTLLKGTYWLSSGTVNITLMSDRLWFGKNLVIDDVLNTILYVNSNFLRVYNHHYAICGCKFMYVEQYDISNSSPTQCCLRFNPMYLATINNLSEPVVKTSDLTMKITYTLTCTEEGEQEAGDS